MKKIFFVLAFVLLLCTTNSVFAQTLESTDEIGEANKTSELDGLKNLGEVDEDVDVSTDSAIIVANVAIYNPSLKQNDRDIDIDFEISNEDSFVQPQIKYSVVLEKITRVDENGSEYGSAVDEYVYDEEFSLNANESAHKKITYRVPDAFFGEFRISILSNNKKGLPLAVATVGKINVDKNKKSVYINPDTCSLSIEGIAEKYSLLEGIDVSKNESLTLNCDLKSDFDKPVRVFPRVTTYNRTLYGQLIDEEKYDDFVVSDNDIMKLQEKISVMEKPQSYDALLGLYDKNGQLISNNVKIHYVTQGMSATIQNIRLDKDSYSDGDIAKISYNFSGRADAFRGSRALGESGDIANEFKVLFDVEIRGEKGVCASEIGLKPTKDLTWNIKIKEECTSPVVVVNLNDENGNVLDSSEYAVTSKEQNTGGDTGNEFLTVYKIIMVVVVLALAILVLVLFLHNRGGGISSFLIMLFFVIGVAFISVPADTQALTLAPESPWSVKPYFLINLTPKQFLDCQTPTVSGKAYVPNCANTIQSKMKVELNGKLFANYYGVCHTKWRVHMEGKESCVNSYFDGWFDVGTKHGCYWKDKKGGSIGYLNESTGMSKDLCRALSKDKKNPEWDGSCYMDLTKYKDIACPVENHNSAETIISSDSVNIDKSIGKHDLNFVASYFKVDGGPVYSKDSGTLSYTVTGGCVDAKCASASPYTYNADQTTWPSQSQDSTYFCASGTPTITPTQSNFPDYGQTTSWDCISEGGTSTSGGACKVIRSVPATKCGTANNVETNAKPTNLCPPNHTASDPQIVNNQWQWTCAHNVIGATPPSATCTAPIPGAKCGTANNVETNAKPTTNLCAKQGDSNVCSWPGNTLPDVSLQNDGGWHWQCEHKPYAYPQTVNCQAPTCLVGDVLQYPSNIYLTPNGQSVNIGVFCNGSGGDKMCCDIEMTPTGSNPKTHICTGESGEFEVPASGEYSAQCYFEDDPTTKVNKPITIHTMCASKECNAQGTCQATPVAANSINDSQCKSTCNSNADCTSGRIIETRP